MWLSISYVIPMLKNLPYPPFSLLDSANLCLKRKEATASATCTQSSTSFIQEEEATLLGCQWLKVKRISVSRGPLPLLFPHLLWLIFLHSMTTRGQHLHHKLACGQTASTRPWVRATNLPAPHAVTSSVGWLTETDVSEEEMPPEGAFLCVHHGRGCRCECDRSVAMATVYRQTHLAFGRWSDLCLAGRFLFTEMKQSTELTCCF